ncbi:MAG: glycosyltransferase family 2 protein [Nitrososphaerales archaeon]
METEKEPESNAVKPKAGVEIQRLRNQVTVVIPTLNEEQAIGILVDEVKGRGYVNVLVVDGYSKDSTAEVAKKSGAHVVTQHGSGKAGALLTAFRFAGTPYLLVMDGDGSYDPVDIDKFLPFMDDFDFIKGAREKNGNMSKIHKIGNAIITKTFNLLFGTFVADICSGMYMLKTDGVRNMTFEKHPLTVEQEIAAEIVLSSGRITSIPVLYKKRLGGKSKTNTWRQGFRDLATNFDLARTHNPILLFSFITSMALIPAVFLLGYASYLDLFLGQYHSGYFLGSLLFFVLGGQGLTVATIASMLRRVERKLNNGFHR